MHRATGQCPLLSPSCGKGELLGHAMTCCRKTPKQANGGRTHKSLCFLCQGTASWPTPSSQVFQEQGVRYGQVSEGVPGLGQVYEGRGRSMLLSSCRGEAKLWDVGACRDRAEALWAPNEAAGDPLRTFEGVRTAIFRPDGLLVSLLWPLPVRDRACLCFYRMA